MERATHRVHAGTLAQFGEQSAGSVAVSLVRVRRIGPHRIVNNLRSLFQVDVQSRLAHVQTSLKSVMARLANLRRLRAGRMVVLEFAGIRGRLSSLGMHRNQFRFDFTQKLLAFVVLRAPLPYDLASRLQVLARRRSLIAALRNLAGRNSHDRGDTLLALARRASIEIGWVVEMTSGTGQSVRRGFASGRAWTIGQTRATANGIIRTRSAMWLRTNRCVRGPRCFHAASPESLLSLV